MSGLPPREKRKGTPLSYPDGLVSVIERTIRDAPIGTRRLNHGAAHSYLASIGITASKEHKRMVKLCIKSTRTKTQRQVRKLRIEWTSQTQNVNGATSSNRAEKAASATVLLHRLEAVDAMITAVMATRKAVEKQVETTLDNTKKANQYLCDVETGDTVWIQLDGYDNLSEATVVDEENENIHVEFVVDKTDDWYPRIHLDIMIVIKAAQQGHDEKRRTETTRASEELDRKNASLSHKNGKRNGRLLCKPQPDRDVFPNPAERPNLYDTSSSNAALAPQTLASKYIKWASLRLEYTPLTGMNTGMRILSGTCRILILIACSTCFPNSSTSTLPGIAKPTVQQESGKSNQNSL